MRDESASCECFDGGCDQIQRQPWICKAPGYEQLHSTHVWSLSVAVQLGPLCAAVLLQELSEDYSVTKLRLAQNDLGKPAVLL